jgi:serine/threonine protein kinase
MPAPAERLHTVLRDLLADFATPLSTTQRLAMVLDVAEGLRYLHSQEPCRIHRNLKSPNLLVTENFVVKLADFGSAKIMQHQKGGAGMAQRLLAGGGVGKAALAADAASELLHTSYVGTLLWQAPEMMGGSTDYGAPVDVHSFAIVMYEVATRLLPWADVARHWDVRAKVVAGERPDAAPCLGCRLCARDAAVLGACALGPSVDGPDGPPAARPGLGPERGIAAPADFGRNRPWAAAKEQLTMPMKGWPRLPVSSLLASQRDSPSSARLCQRRSGCRPGLRSVIVVQPDFFLLLHSSTSTVAQYTSKGFRHNIE